MIEKSNPLLNYPFNKNAVSFRSCSGRAEKAMYFNTKGVHQFMYLISCESLCCAIASCDAWPSRSSNTLFSLG